MKIGIIGAGWYGCHLAYQLSKKNYKVKIFEKNKNIFNGMSGNNSNRLHKGFHYPRSYETRDQCRKSFNKFKKVYPTLSKKINKNIIGIHKNSIIDFETYKQILKQTNLDFNIYTKLPFKFRNVEGFIKCDEEVIDFKKSSDFFNKKLKKILYLNSNIKKINYYKNYPYIMNEKFDWVIDCTACTLDTKYEFDINFEPRITLVYKSIIKNFACMLMDGPFWSIYPTIDSEYTLGSVIYSRIQKKTTLSKAKNVLQKLNNKDVIKIKKNFEKQVSKDFQNFKKYFKYKTYYCSLTTILNSSADSRPVLVNKNGKRINVLGGKIDSIFVAEDIVKNILNQN